MSDGSPKAPPAAPSSIAKPTARRRSSGMTLVEVLVGLAIVAILAFLLVPLMLQRIMEAKMQSAIGDMRTLGDEIGVYATELGDWPTKLEDLDRPIPLDPWGNPYRYLSSSDKSWKGKSRRDRFLVPLNSDFDLYSSGPDGKSVAPLTASASRDDLIRADDGGFYGAAADF